MAVSQLYTLLGLLCLGAHLTYGKGFYCRDPDTGKLHDVNSTWPSTTFCGNYTCKLRKKGYTETEFVVPIRQFKVANVSISDIVTKKPKSEIKYENSSSETQNNYDPQNEKPKTDDILDEMTTENDDRYLNENEIKTIARLLHRIKKSDLAAIVDIYNLAKDIHEFEDTESVPSKNVVDKTLNSINHHNEKTNKVKQNTYWYDPIHNQHKNKKNVDMVYQGSDHVPIAHQIHEDDPISYFKDTLTKNDFGKLPYYYPMSSFQREYSYTYPSNPVQQSPPYSTTQISPLFAPQNKPYPVVQSQPCSVKPCSQHYLNHPYKYPIIQGISQVSNGVLKKPFALETIRQQEPILLPYPYSYIQHYNSTVPGYYYDRNLWALVDMYGKYNNYYKPYYIANVLDTSLRSKTEPKEDNSVEKNNITEDLIKSLISKTKEQITKTSRWQTPPISNDVLEDVRAHIQEKSTLLKPFPLRRKVKVEKVGKVINLDELNKRTKRNALNEKEVTEKENVNHEEFEAYIERTTCGTDNVPGYFRIGNLTGLYPACCPQRINKSH